MLEWLKILIFKDFEPKNDPIVPKKGLFLLKFTFHQKYGCYNFKPRITLFAVLTQLNGWEMNVWCTDELQVVIWTILTEKMCLMAFLCQLVLFHDIFKIQIYKKKIKFLTID